MSYSAIAVANYFIDKSLSNNCPVTNMKMQKLVFFAHAVYFHERHQPLISDPITAMQHGPVIMSLYTHLKKYGSSPIKQTISSLLGKPSFHAFAKKIQTRVHILTEYGRNCPPYKLGSSAQFLTWKEERGTRHCVILALTPIIPLI